MVFVRVGDQEDIDVEPPLAVPGQPISQDGRHIRRIVIRIIRRSADIHVDKDLPPALELDKCHVAVADREKRDLRHHARALLLGRMAFQPAALGSVAVCSCTSSRRQICRRNNP